MKKKYIIIGCIVLVLIAASVITFLIINSKYTVTFNTDGGTTIEKIKIKKGENLTLPNEPSKEGYIFGGFVYNDKIATNYTKVNSDMEIKVRWIPKDKEVITISYIVNNSTITVISVKGEVPMLLETPVMPGNTFIGWLNDEGYVVDENATLDKNTTLKPRWIKAGEKTVTVKFNTDGGNKINDLVLAKDSVIILPVEPVKKGYKFEGWVQSNGTQVTSETTIDRDTVITAKWVVPYTCPQNCTPNEDGSKCTRTTTTNTKEGTGCSKGYTLKNGKCLNYSGKYQAENTNGWTCKNKSDYMYTEEDGVGGAFMWCVPTTSTVKTVSCEDRYNLSNGSCVKTETIDCTRN